MRERLTLVLDVRCRDRDLALLRVERYTWPGAPSRLVQVGVPVMDKRKPVLDEQGRPLVSFAAETEDGRVQLVCKRCERDVDVRLDEIDLRLTAVPSTGAGAPRKGLRTRWAV